jgi:hypothetical protein
MVSFEGNKSAFAEEVAGIKPAKVAKGLPSQLSPSQERGTSKNQVISSRVRPLMKPGANGVSIVV